MADGDAIGSHSGGFYRHYCQTACSRHRLSVGAKDRGTGVAPGTAHNPALQKDGPRDSITPCAKWKAQVALNT